MERLSIGKMADLNHISVQTLRYYDNIGLLKPVFVDKENNYRYYSIKQSAKLDMIQYMKSLGMSLEKIKEQFEKKDVTVILEMLEEQKQWIDVKMKELHQMKKAITICLENYSRYLKLPKDGYIELQHIPERKIFCYDVKKNIYERDGEGYEYILRELKKQAVLCNLPMLYFCNVGSIIRNKKLVEKEFVSTEIFLYLDEDLQLKENVEIIPENKYICMYGYCDIDDDFMKEKEYAYRLFQYIKDNNYKVVGDYICEVVVELPVFTHYERNMFIKLQVPIIESY